jgi:hypothetical protein
MSEESPESTGTETGQVDDGAASGTDAEDDEGSQLLAGMAEQTPEELARELKDWKTRSRQWEDRSKKNADAARELSELKKAQMTEAQRVQVERDEAIRERDEARADHSRVMAAAAHNLPVDLIDYLGTGTDEEISGRAEAIAGAIETRATELAEERVQQLLQEQGNGSRNGFSSGARPVESMRAGSAPSGGSASPRDTNAWFRGLFGSRE